MAAQLDIYGHRPYKFIGFGDIYGPKPYKFIGFGDIYGPKPYKFIGFGDSTNLDRLLPKFGPGPSARSPKLKSQIRP